MNVEQFFTPANIISVATATAAITFAAKTLHSVFNAPPKITAFLAAMIIAYLIVFMKKNPEGYEWILAFFNGCLLFCSATGVNEVGHHATKKKGKGIAGGEPLVKSWFEHGG